MCSHQEFVYAFQNLNGVTLAEKRKQFFMLFNRFKFADQNNVDNILSSIIPRNYIQSIFRIEVLIFFKRSSDLFQVLKSQPYIVTRKIFKSKWFFQEPFETISAETFVNEFLPEVSVITRYRIIKCLGKYHRNEVLLDNIFDKLCEKYGFASARPILIGCGEAKLEVIFNCFHVNLTQKELKLIHKKHPQAIKVYMQSNHCFNFSNMKFLQYLPCKEPDVFFKLVNGWEKIHMTLGKRATQKLLNHDKSEVMKNPQIYIEIFHSKIFYKNLKREELKLVLKNLCPKNVTQFRFYTLCSLLRYLPNKDKYTVYSEVFQSAYNKSLFDNVQCMDEYLVESIVDDAEREKWIAAKLKEGVTDTRYIHCYELNRALNLIKSKINLTSTVRLREALVEKMIDTCKFHKNDDALLEVLQYFCKRHRNDPVLTDFVSHLIHVYCLPKLTAEHWKYVLELLEIMKVKNLFFGQTSCVLLQYVEYLWIDKKDVKEKLLEIINNGNLNEESTYNILQLEDKSLQKLVLTTLIEFLPQKVANLVHMQDKDVKLILFILKWNKKCPKDAVSLDDHPRLINSLKSVIQREMAQKHYKELLELLKPLFDQYICSNGEDDLTRYLTNVYFSILPFGEKVNIVTNQYRNKYALGQYSESVEKKILWYLKNYPQFVLKYLNEIVVVLYENIKFSKRILYYVKMLDTLNPIENSLIEFGQLNYEREDINTNHVLRILACLLQPQSYINIVKHHIPLDDKMDIESDNYHYKFSLTESVGNSFKYDMIPDILPTILEFCKENYLTCGLNSLYYQFLHCPYKHLQIFINEFLLKPTNICKHAYYLQCQFAPVKDVIESFKNFADIECDNFTRKDLLLRSLKYLKQNQIEELFDIVLLQISYISKKDKKILNLLNDCVKLSNKYKIKFMAYLSNHSTLVYDTDNVMFTLINNFLNQLDNTSIQHLPTASCNDFIQKYFLNDSQNIQEDTVNSFILQYILSLNEVVSKKCNIIFKKIYDFRIETNGNFKSRVYCKKKITKILQSFYPYFVAKNVKISQTFYDGLLKVLPFEEFFEVLYQLQMIIILKESGDLKTFSVHLNRLLQETVSNYGYISNILADSVKYLFKEDSDSKEKLLSLSCLLFEINKSRFNCFFILKLLPNRFPDEENESKYLKLIDSLAEQKDPSILIRLNAI